MQLDNQEIKLILASLEMMVRLSNQSDAKMSKSECEKVTLTADGIRRKFYMAVIGSDLHLVGPDEFTPPRGLE